VRKYKNRGQRVCSFAKKIADRGCQEDPRKKGRERLCKRLKDSHGGKLADTKRENWAKECPARRKNQKDYTVAVKTEGKKKGVNPDYKPQNERWENPARMNEALQALEGGGKGFNRTRREGLT